MIRYKVKLCIPVVIPHSGRWLKAAVALPKTIFTEKAQAGFQRSTVGGYETWAEHASTFLYPRFGSIMTGATKFRWLRSCSSGTTEFQNSSHLGHF